MVQEEIDKVPKVIELRARRKSAAENAATEGHVYNHLYQFFSRYYDSGDFMSLRRIRANGDTSYLIPYNGEEVKLHWANADQYYIKTTENFASYIFGHENWPKNAKVRFEIAVADTEKDNIKAESDKDRRFVLTTRKGQAQIAADGDQLVIYSTIPALDGCRAAALPGEKRQARLNDETQASTCVWRQNSIPPGRKGWRNRPRPKTTRIGPFWPNISPSTLRRTASIISSTRTCGVSCAENWICI